MCAEVWREVEQGYSVSSWGRARSPRKILKLQPDRSGKYLAFCTYPVRHNRRLHAQVGRLFLVNPRPDIFDMLDHIDENKGRNHWSNLRWVNSTLNHLNSGVCATRLGGPRKKRWMAYTRENGKQKCFGVYHTFEEASRVGKAAQKVEFKRIYKELTGCDSCGIGPKWFKA